MWFGAYHSEMFFFLIAVKYFVRFFEGLKVITLLLKIILFIFLNKKNQIVYKQTFLTLVKKKKYSIEI